MEIETEKRSTITEELENGYTLVVRVDHLDDDVPYELNIGSEEFGWMSQNDINTIIRVFNKAKRLHSA